MMRLSLFCAIIAAAQWPLAAVAQTPAIPWMVFGATGETSVSGTTTLHSTFAENFAYTASSGNLELSAGFLAGIRFAGQTTVSVPLLAGWNMLSNPVTTTADSMLQLFPTSSFPYAFGYVPGVGYSVQYRLLNGSGYWGKFPGSTASNITGGVRSLDSVSVQAGWNMIGSISFPVDTATVTSVPPGLRTSLFFGYSAGYATSATIVPGKAYWVRASGSGKLFLASSSLASPAHQSSPLDAFSTLTITDANGGEQILYLGLSSAAGFPVELFDMPPSGPQGTFDVRFESDRMLEVYGTEPSTHAIAISSDAYPLTLRWSGRNEPGREVFLQDGVTGSLVPRTNLSTAATVVITDPAANRLVLTTGLTDIPSSFSLSQNFPNPFNPSTTIRFDLPVDGAVVLAVYNTLGQKVETLIENEHYAAGRHSMQFDAAHLASGVYFYRLQAPGFTRVMKMTVLK